MRLQAGKGLCVGGLVLGLLSAVPAAPATARVAPWTSPRVELTGVIRISGSDSGYVPVTLPRAARISIAEHQDATGPNRDVKLEGDGRFVGVALVEDPYPEIRRTGRFFMAGRFSQCAGGACAGSEFTNVIQALDARGPRLRLKPGDYRLYLIADGAPVDVELRFHGLAGTKTLSVPGSDVVDMQSPPTHLDHTVGDESLWSAGSSFDGGQVGFSFSMLSVDADTFEGMKLGFCQFNALHPPPAEIAYGPHCSALTPALGSGAEVTFDSEWRAHRFSITASFGYNANEASVGLPNLTGSHGLGAWVTAPSPLDDVSFQGFFLKIE